jgi:nicotinamidase-related amidase
MTNNPNELTIENSVLVLIDHQPWIALMALSIDPTVMINNVAGLAQAAKNLGVPTILTTIGAKGSILVDPLFKEITEIFPDVTPIDRTSTHAWSHPEFRAAIDATGRKKLIMAGLVTEVCLAQSVLAALKEGYEVYSVPAEPRSRPMRTPRRAWCRPAPSRSTGSLSQASGFPTTRRRNAPRLAMSGRAEAAAWACWSTTCSRRSQPALCRCRPGLRPLRPVLAGHRPTGRRKRPPQIPSKESRLPTRRQST